MKTEDEKNFDPFALRPVKAAKISEISEATAAAEVPAEERVNFHIGNPVQDDRLSSMYFRIALGLDIHRHDHAPDAIPAILEELGWDSTQAPKLELLSSMIKKSAPYMPRGGYLRSNPNDLITIFNDWLLKG